MDGKKHSSGSFAQAGQPAADNFGKVLYRCSLCSNDRLSQTPRFPSVRARIPSCIGQRSRVVRVPLSSNHKGHRAGVVPQQPANRPFLVREGFQGLIGHLAYQRHLADDIYDGNTPATIRRYSDAILTLRSDPNLMNELTDSAIPSIAPVLLEARFKASQRANRSIFFFSGPERMLQDT